MTTTWGWARSALSKFLVCRQIILLNLFWGILLCFLIISDDSSTVFSRSSHDYLSFAHEVVELDKQILKATFTPQVDTDKLRSLDGQNRQSLAFSEPGQLSQAIPQGPRGTNVERVNANRAMRIATQGTQGL